jgi:hypothetical protein
MPRVAAKRLETLESLDHREVVKSIESLTFEVDRLTRLVEDLEHAVRNLPERIAVAIDRD